MTHDSLSHLPADEQLRQMLLSNMELQSELNNYHTSMFFGLRERQRSMFKSNDKGNQSTCAFLASHFSFSELQDLAFQLGIGKNWFTLDCTLDEYAVELVTFAQSMRKIPRLAEIIIDKRPLILKPKPTSPEQSQTAEYVEMSELLHNTYLRFGNNPAIINNLAFYLNLVLQHDSNTQPWHAMRELLQQCSFKNRLHLLRRYIYELYPLSQTQSETNKKTVEMKRQQIRGWLEKFTLEEIKTLCFVLGIRYDNLRGIDFIDKKISLVNHCTSTNQLNDLEEKIKAARPNLFKQQTQQQQPREVEQPYTWATQKPEPTVEERLPQLPDYESEASLKQSKHMLQYALYLLKKSAINDISVKVTMRQSGHNPWDHQTTANVYESGDVYVNLPNLSPQQVAQAAWQVRLMVFRDAWKNALGGNELASFADPKFTGVLSIFGKSRDNVAGQTVAAKITSIVADMQRTVGNTDRTNQLLQRMENFVYFGDQGRNKREYSTPPNHTFALTLKSLPDTVRDELHAEAASLLNHLSQHTLRDPEETKRFTDMYREIWPSEQVLASLLIKLPPDQLTALASHILSPEIATIWKANVQHLGSKTELVLVMVKKAYDFSQQYNANAPGNFLVSIGQTILRNQSHNI